MYLLVHTALTLYATVYISMDCIVEEPAPCISELTTYTYKPTCCEGYASSYDAGLVDKSTNIRKLLKSEGCPISKLHAQSLSIFVYYRHRWLVYLFLNITTSTVCFMLPLSGPTICMKHILYCYIELDITTKATCVMKGAIRGKIEFTQPVTAWPHNKLRYHYFDIKSVNNTMHHFIYIYIRVIRMDPLYKSHVI